jgi:hypothetical protein
MWEQEGVLAAELDTDFDAVGHYARPDVFRLEGDERAMPAVSNRPISGGVTASISTVPRRAGA